MSKIDYFSVLYPAIAALNPNDSQSRASIYKRARTMVANRALDSVAANAEISKELHSLENAIQRIEDEFSRREAEDIEYLSPPPGSIDLEPRSGWLWKSAAAASVLIAAAVAGYFTFAPWGENQRAPAGQIDRVISPTKPADVIQAFDTTEGDHRPYTQRRQLVYYRTTYPPGALVISKSQKFLYLVRPNLSALRYSIAVGRKCTESVGLYQISDKEEFPGWNDPAPAAQASSLSPLLSQNANPLGARALYLERDDRSIHGISRVVSTGSSLACFQLVNEDIIDLYERVPVGTRVVAMN
jgi:lipoprotein-anchoring transpeptidase ErfK/SrfK